MAGQNLNHLFFLLEWNEPLELQVCLAWWNLSPLPQRPLVPVDPPWSGTSSDVTWPTHIHYINMTPFHLSEVNFKKLGCGIHLQF